MATRKLELYFQLNTFLEPIFFLRLFANPSSGVAPLAQELPDEVFHETVALLGQRTAG